MHDPTVTNQRGYWSGGKNREANCGLYTLKKDGDALLDRFSTGTWGLRHVVKCGKWTCPMCGRERARAAANQLGVCLEVFLAVAEHSAVMLTKTTPHDITDVMSELVEKQFAADAKFCESAEWRAFKRLGECVGRNRALDVTFGGDNGTHPHFHELVYLDNLRIPVGWSSESLTRQQKRARARAIAKQPYDARVRMELADIAHEDKLAHDRQQRFESLLGEHDIDKLLGKPLRAHDPEVQQAYLDELARPLIRAWLRCCKEAGIVVRDEAAFYANAIDLRPCTDAAQYLVKWGLADEVSSTPQKHRSHLRLLDIVGAGDQVGATAQQQEWGQIAAELFRQWRDATVGKTWLTGVADICNRLGVTDDDVRAYAERRRVAREAELAAKGEPVVHVPELHLAFPSYLTPAVVSLGGWHDVIKFVEGIERECPGADLQEAATAFLWRKLGDRGQRDACLRAELELARLRAPPDG